VKTLYLVAQGKLWNDGGALGQGARRSLLAAPPTTVVPGAAAVGIVGKAPATCWDSSNGATVVSAKCSGAKTQQWDFTSAGGSLWRPLLLYQPQMQRARVRNSTRSNTDRHCSRQILQGYLICTAPVIARIGGSLAGAAKT